MLIDSETGRIVDANVVSDDGAGMDAETRARIFEPFFTTKPAPLGTGLGMSMVYGLVCQQEGWITVESAPRQGTAVRIGFRRGIAPGASDDGASHPEEPLQGLPSGTETILVVEDERSLRRAMTRELERLGYTVLTAADGEEAVELFRARRSEVHLVLSDIIMPRLGGRGLYEALRREGHTVRFLFSSGYGTEEIRQLGVDRVPPALIRKPWTVVDLAERVRSVLDA